MLSLLFLSLMSFANSEQSFSEGSCERSYVGTLYCEDNKKNICIVYEYEDGYISFGCKKKDK